MIKQLQRNKKEQIRSARACYKVVVVVVVGNERLLAKQVKVQQRYRKSYYLWSIIENEAHWSPLRSYKGETLHETLISKQFPLIGNAFLNLSSVS